MLMAISGSWVTLGPRYLSLGLAYDSLASVYAYAPGTYVAYRVTGDTGTTPATLVANVTILWV
jgi:hypothetical protein